MPYANPQDKADWAARYHREHAEQVAEYKRQWQRRNREKRQAHITLGNAIRDGLVTKRPCEECGSLVAEAHHDDYSKPLEVRWLCDTHHKALHVEQRRAA